MTADRLPATGTVACELFDCLQVNLAVLADRLHGDGTHVRLGATLRFRPRPGDQGLPTVEPSLDLQLADAERALGLKARHRRTTRTVTALVPGTVHYVVADAYHLPWVPYFGQRHLEHSFLLEELSDGTAFVIDGYHTETPWGSARPCGHVLDRSALASALPDPALVVTFEPASCLPVLGPEQDTAGAEAVEAYVTAYAGHPDQLAALHQLTLESWLLARSRKLHSRFLEARGTLPEGAPAHSHVRDWEALSESVYMAYRRAERGRPVPAGLHTRLAELLHGDVEVFGAATGHRTGSVPSVPDARVPEPLRRRVAAAAAAVLRTDPATLLGGHPLDRVRGYTSFRVVEIIERLESELAVEFAADDLVPENLRDVDAICRIVPCAPTAGDRATPTTGGGI